MKRYALQNGLLYFTPRDFKLHETFTGAVDVVLASDYDEALSCIRELVALCAIGDVDEGTEAYGWGAAIERAKSLLPSDGNS